MRTNTAKHLVPTHDVTTGRFTPRLRPLVGGVSLPASAPLEYSVGFSLKCKHFACSYNSDSRPGLCRLVRKGSDTSQNSPFLGGARASLLPGTLPRSHCGDIDSATPAILLFCLVNPHGFPNPPPLPLGGRGDKPSKACGLNSVCPRYKRGLRRGVKLLKMALSRLPSTRFARAGTPRLALRARRAARMDHKWAKKRPFPHHFTCWIWQHAILNTIKSNENSEKKAQKIKKGPQYIDAGDFHKKTSTKPDAQTDFLLFRDIGLLRHAKISRNALRGITLHSLLETLREGIRLIICLSLRASIEKYKYKYAIIF
jgi:hypothetical protein